MTVLSELIFVSASPRFFRSCVPSPSQRGLEELRRDRLFREAFAVSQPGGWAGGWVQPCLDLLAFGRKLDSQIKSSPGLSCRHSAYLK